jgi:hypothetical protein
MSKIAYNTEEMIPGDLYVSIVDEVLWADEWGQLHYIADDGNTYVLSPGGDANSWPVKRFWKRDR